MFAFPAAKAIAAFSFAVTLLLLVRHRINDVAYRAASPISDIVVSDCFSEFQYNKIFLACKIFQKSTGIVT